MKRFGLAFAIVVLFSSSVVVAQSGSIQGEFIESSSPLANGGRVTTRSEPGRRVQTTVTIPASYNRSPGNRQTNPNGANGAGANPSGSQNRDSSVLNGSSSRDGQTNGNGGNGRYPYPATYPANSGRGSVGQAGNFNSNPSGSGTRVASLPNIPNNPNQAAVNANSQVNASRIQYQNNCCVPVQNHCCGTTQGGGLGLTPAPNFGGTVPNFNPLPGAGFQQPGFQQPGLAGGGVQPALSQPPQAGLGFQNGAGNLGFGQIGGGGGVRSSGGVYQPLFPILRMPSGSYLGQGLIGQPEAYVNNQPVRNFFRYLLPF